MLKDFISQTGRIHEARLQEWSDQARLDALRREARSVRRLRRTVGHKLIALGARIADQETPDHEAMDPAA